MGVTAWSHQYDYQGIDGERKQYWKGPFLFITEATVTASWPDVLKVMYRVGVWLNGGVSEEVEPVLRKIGLSAERIDGIVGMNGDYRKWECRKLNEDARVQSQGRTKLFELWTDKPVKPVRTERQKGAKSFDLDIEVTFKLSGNRQERSAFLHDTVHPPSHQQPGSTCNDSILLFARPSNLALQICLSSPNRIHYVWIPEELLPAASAYLAILMKAVDKTSRASFRVVADDSDDEEDTERYNATKGSEEEDRESSESPAEESRYKRRRKSGRNPLVNRYLAGLPRVRVQGVVWDGKGALDEEEKQAFLMYMDSRSPVEGSEVIAIYDCALSTLRAVVDWVAYGRISFAPLALDGKEKRTIAIRIAFDKKPTHSLPVSPRSVYRLAIRFGLEKLAVLALADLKAKLTNDSAGYKKAAALAFHRDCVNYPEIKTLVHDFVRKNYNYDSMRGSLRKHVKEGYQKKLLGELLEPILEKLRLPS